MSGDSTEHKQHTSKLFAAELTEIRGKVLTLGGLVEEQIDLALKALHAGDVELAALVIRNDHPINSLEVSIDSDCTQILARRQPAASDLRLVVAVLKTVNDLERIGDDAKRIAHFTMDLASYAPRRDILATLNQFGQRLRSVLKETLNAFARVDFEQALRIRRDDADINRDYRLIVESIVASMTDDSRTIPVGLHLMWIAKALERIGDRCCNICEYIVYYVKGKDIRHVSPEQVDLDLHGLSEQGD